MINKKTNGSIVCPSCGRLISANSKVCMHCGRKNPGLWGYGPSINKILANLSGPTQYIIAACVALYVISLLIDPRAIFQSMSPFSLFSPSGKALIKMGMTGSFVWHYGRWFTMITAIYLHGGVLHILFNMLWLNQLGPMVEQLFGRSRMFLIFTFAGFFGFFLSNIFGISATIGASGSVFGLLGALVYYGRKRGGAFGTAIYKQVGIWAVVLFVFGFMMPGVNNFAHFGGFAGGYVSAFILGFHEERFETKNHRRLGLIAAAVTVISFLLVWFF